MFSKFIVCLLKNFNIISFYAGYEPCRYFFEFRLAKFREELTPRQREWVDDIRKETWTLTYDEGGRRSGHMTTNLSEAVNKVLKGARNLPITALVKVVYSRLVTYFVTRAENAEEMLAKDQVFVPKVMDELEKNIALASSYEVTRYNRANSKFEVQEPVNPHTGGGGMKWKVSLYDRKCECGRWQAYKYPSAHVIAGCNRVEVDWVSMWILFFLCRLWQTRINRSGSQLVMI